MSKDLIINYQEKPCYNIAIRSDFSDLQNELKKLNKNYDYICVVTDSNVAPIYLDQILDILKSQSANTHSFVFDAGEKSKNLNTVQNLYEYLIENKFTRNSLLVALGGGVVGDLTGFTASTYLRSIDFIQIPTTLLAQVDSSIGGKTGVDFNQYKNMVGAFYMPRLVYMNLTTLNSLDDYNFAGGMSEVIKSALIQNKAFYNWLKSNSQSILNKDFSALEHLVFECCKIKGHVVEIDPNEKGIRAYLNYGHTLGHAIEKLSNFTLGHGQCVALGMVTANYLSRKLGFISKDEENDINKTILQYNLPLSVPNIKKEDVLAASKNDKKMTGNKIKFVVLKEVGLADTYLEFSDDDLLESLKMVCE